MEQISTGVLIIGSGGAGLRCAIALKENGFNNFLIVGAREIADAHTVLAAGGVNAALGSMDPEDSWEVHATDTFYEGQSICNPHLVEKLCKGAPSAIEDLVRFGAQFHSEDDGRLTQRFFGAHTYRRTVFSGDQTGKEIINALIRRVGELDIQYLENVYIFKLLTDGKKVIGAAAVDQKGKVIYISASKVVLASGGYSNIYKRSSSRSGENYGNGISMAIEAGATVGDMEMVQFHPTSMVFPQSVAGTLITEAVRAEGGILKNMFGERFMSRYEPKRMELATRDQVARAIYFEIKEGNGTPNGGVYLDITSRDEKYLKERLPKVYQLIKEENGIDLTKEPMEVAPTAHYTMGGIYIDYKTHQSSVENLYAIGECTMGLHGANRLGGNSLAEILVFGKELGELLANEKINEAESLSKYSITEVEQNINDSCKEGEQLYNQVLIDIKDVLWSKVGIVRSRVEMEDALQNILEKEKLLKSHGLINRSNRRDNIVCTSRVTSAIQLAKLVTMSAIERTESRGAHYRSDYPKLNIESDYNIFFKKAEGELKMEKRKGFEPSEQFEEVLKKYKRTENYTHLE